MVAIHPTALVEPGAELAEGVSIGAYTIVGPDVRVGRDTSVGSHTILEGWTEIGADCRIGPHAIIGAPPQDVKYRGEPTQVVIGDRTLVREFATIHRASTGGSGVTSVGPDCFIMAYAHVAHDCQLAERVIMANQASLAGHVEIGRHAVIGGMSGVHQFVRIGEYAFLGACSGVLQDIPPYVKAQGNRAKPFGLNVVGLRRHGFSVEAIHALKQAYRILFISGLNTSQALAQLEQELSGSPEVQRFVDFVKRSQRGISK
ncbi:MAG: acyl-ACP--UDP-N-acetylglucosamine O-acyltransferase [candidate division NC10 bacterium]|nr:acyl-ACP--UDP-N-acetylglucosamine O-acyltransferase [candidate division NC10 bacterium]